MIRLVNSFLFGVLMRSRFTIGLLSWLNRRKQFLHTVFVAYPAEEDYALAYIPKSKRHIMRWTPWPVGFYRQSGKWGITFVISATEDDFANPENLPQLRSLHETVESMRIMLGAAQTSYSGVLPGILFSKRIKREVVEADVTVRVLVAVEQQLREIREVQPDAPIFILGGDGFIGRRFRKAMVGRRLVTIEIGQQIPTEFRGSRVIVFNISRRYALLDHIDSLWRGAIVVNEVYPEPSSHEITALEQKGVECYHVVGIRALAFPPFPNAYRGGIPCCAGHLSDDIAPLLRKLC